MLVCNGRSHFALDRGIGADAASEFLFEIDPEPVEESSTALGGVPLLVRAWSAKIQGQVEMPGW